MKDKAVFALSQCSWNLDWTIRITSVYVDCIELLLRLYTQNHKFSHVFRNVNSCIFNSYMIPYQKFELWFFWITMNSYPVFHYWIQYHDFRILNYPQFSVMNSNDGFLLMKSNSWIQIWFHKFICSWIHHFINSYMNSEFIQKNSIFISCMNSYRLWIQVIVSYMPVNSCIYEFI